MSRKDYILIAAALKSVRDSYAPHWDPNLFRACDDHAVALAKSLSAANPAFNAAKFLLAAGVK